MKALLLNRILLVLAFAGLFVAGVLSAGHLFDIEVPCGVSRDCQVVADHPSSTLFGLVPVAYLGFLTYVALAGLAVMRVLKGITTPLVLTGYLLAAIGTVFSLYLQYQSFMVIKAKCPWCIASAIIMIVTLILHAVLYQVLENNRTAQPPKGQTVDSVLLMALPLALLVAIGVQYVNMQNASKAGVNLPGGAVLPADLKDQLLAGAHKFGPEDAKVTIVEYADLQCGACQARSPQVKAFAEQFPDKIQFAFRHFPLDMHKWAAPSAAVAEYAAEKGKFWEFIMAVMEHQREYENVNELYDTAASVGLDLNDLKARITKSDDKVYERIQADMELADRVGIVQTPTFFIFVGDGKPQIANSANIFDILQSKEIQQALNE